MQNIIRKDTLNEKALEAVHSSMERIWAEARKRLPGQATTLDVITERH